MPVDDFSKGVVFYLNEIGKVVGVLTWNLFGKMDLAKQVRYQLCKCISGWGEENILLGNGLKIRILLKLWKMTQHYQC